MIESADVDLTEMLDVARAAIAQGCDLLRTSAIGAVHSKADRDYATDLDLRIQDSIRLFLRDTAPWAGFLGEEDTGLADSAPDARWRWILDPIDGTANFAHHVPLCAVSLALAHDDEPIIGAIGAPFLGMEYSAIVGQGAYSNGKRIRASAATDLAGSVVSIGDYAVGAGAAAKNTRRFAVTAELATNVERIRMLGSAALDLVWVAEGRLDACVLLTNKPWDTAAGTIIAREAGATVTDSDGSRHTLASTHTIAAAPGISQPLLSLLSATEK